MNWMKSIVWAVAIIGAPALVVAGPGDSRESHRYSKILDRRPLKCPTGTKLTVQDGRHGTEELCLNARGERNGYYLQWHRNSDSWAFLGQYRSGKKVGRWVKFSNKGKPVAVSYYSDAGRVRRGASLHVQ